MSRAAAVPQKPKDHAGAMCPKCTGNIMLKDDMYICLQCGTVTGYAIRELPSNNQPYAPSSNRTPQRALPLKNSRKKAPPAPTETPAPEPHDCAHIQPTPTIPAELTFNHTKTCKPEPSEGGQTMQHHAATAGNPASESGADGAVQTLTTDPPPRLGPEMDPQTHRQTGAPAELQTAPENQERTEPKPQDGTRPETDEPPGIEEQAQPAAATTSDQDAQQQAVKETAPQAGTLTDNPGQIEPQPQPDQDAGQPVQPRADEPITEATEASVSHREPYDQPPADEEEPHAGTAASTKAEPPIRQHHPERETTGTPPAERGQQPEANSRPASEPAPDPTSAPIDSSAFPYGLTPEEAAQTFGNAAQAEAWFLRKRWPTGVHCPQCNSKSLNNRLVATLPAYQCRSCGNAFSMLQDTPLQGTRTPIAKWLLISHALLMNPKSPPNVNRVATEFKAGWMTVKNIREATTKSLSKGLFIYQYHPPEDPGCKGDRSHTVQPDIPNPAQGPSNHTGDQPKPATDKGEPGPAPSAPKPASAPDPRSAPDRHTPAGTKGNRAESAQTTLEELRKTIELHRENLKLQERELYQQAEAAGKEIIRVEEQLSIIQQSIAISQDWKSQPE